MLSQAGLRACQLLLLAGITTLPLAFLSACGGRNSSPTATVPQDGISAATDETEADQGDESVSLAPIDISTLTFPYTQTFDTLQQDPRLKAKFPWVNDLTLEAWYSNQRQYSSSDGSLSKKGGFYSFGTIAATERALGAQEISAIYGVRLVNTSGITITALQISYTGEQWRNSGAAAQTVDFQYQVGVPGSITGINTPSTGWIDGNSLDFTSPITAGVAGPLDGNLDANQQEFAAVNLDLSSTPISPGQEIWLRWVDVDHPGADHGLAIDDLTIAASSLPTLPTPSHRIHDIQGAAHVKPAAITAVTNVPGIVTAVRSTGNSRGFFMQDPQPDSDPNTSEGIFVFLGSSATPTVVPGDFVTVSGTASEFRPGGSTGPNLSITQISSPTVTKQGTFPLPDPITIGSAGLLPPTQVFSNDAVGGNLEDPATTFDPANDGSDFYESLEGMRVQVNNAFVVGPTAIFGSSGPTPGNAEVYVLPDNGAGAGLRTPREGIIAQPNDFNPERVVINNLFVTIPDLVVGDQFPGPTVGVLGYDFGKYLLFATEDLTVAPGGLPKEDTKIKGKGTTLAVATFNVENLSPNDPSSKFAGIADAIINNLNSPDIISLEEIQDNNGPVNDAVVDANITLNTLVSAIINAGGPAYQFRQINPVDDQDGGQPGGNIRVGFLFNPARVTFVDRAGATSTTANAVINNGGLPELQFSPGRIDPTNAAWATSRKPLAGEFLFQGRKIFVVANHFNSKGGDDPLFGRNEPPILVTEPQRNQQAAVVADFVNDIFAIDPNANVLVMGDLNDFEFSNPINILKSAGLTTLIETLPVNERYTYTFQGNSQTLDHIMVSNALNSRLDKFDVVHINSEYPDSDRVSDHDPAVASFKF